MINFEVDASDRNTNICAELFLKITENCSNKAGAHKKKKKNFVPHNICTYT